MTAGSGRDRRSRRLGLVVLLTVLTALAATLLVGHGPWAGDPLLDLGAGRGVNQGDLVVAGAWLVGLATCAALWRRP